MVFSTVESSITKSGQALGIFNKDWHDVIYDIQHTSGIANKFKAAFSTTISSTDLDAIRKYNTEIKNGVTSQTAFNRCMLNTSATAQNLVASANGAAVSEEAMTAATNQLTLAQRAAAFASKALGVALNVALNVGIMFAINAIITGITKLVNRQKELKESTDELISSFKSVKDEANDLSKNSDTLASEYSKLSKGVDGLGQNVSLTAEEYERYKEVTNQIAEDIPSLIKGYDDEGNAILDLKGNVDELKQAYINARREKYNLMLLEQKDTVDDTIKNYRNLNGDNWYQPIKSAFDLGNADIGWGITVKDAIQDLKTILSASYDEVQEMLKVPAINYETDLLTSHGRSYLAKLGLDTATTKKEFEELRNTLKTELQKLQAEVQTGLTGVKDVANIYLFSNEDYYKLDEDMQNIASVIVNGITEELAETFENSADVGAYVIDIVDKLKEATPEVKSAYTNLFDLSLDEMSISKAKNQVDKYIQEIADYLGVDANQLKIQLGFSIVDENQDELQHIMSKAVSKYSKGRRTYSSSFLASAEEHGVNTKEELNILNECVEATTNATAAWELYDQRIAETTATNEDNIRSLEELKEAYDKLSDSASNYSKNQKTL